MSAAALGKKRADEFECAEAQAVVNGGIWLRAAPELATSLAAARDQGQCEHSY